MQKSRKRLRKIRTSRFFERLAAKITRAAGRPAVSVGAFVLVLMWAAMGPVFNFSDTWQLVINTGTTVITFLMVFIIQQSQNKDTQALQLKLNELIACNKEASNRMVDIEDLSEDELDMLKAFYVRLPQQAAREKNLHESHSFDE